MRTGRHPKPVEIKKREGNPGKRKLKEPVFIAPVVDGFPAPDMLDEIGIRKWNAVAAFLSKAGILTEIDVDCLAGYCASYSRWYRAEKEMQAAIAKKPDASGILVNNDRRIMISPLIRAAQSSLDSMAKLAAQYGMTPVSRGSVSRNPDEEENPFADILKPPSVKH